MSLAWAGRSPRHLLQLELLVMLALRLRYATAPYISISIACHVESALDPGVVWDFPRGGGGGGGGRSGGGLDSPPSFPLPPTTCYEML